MPSDDYYDDGEVKEEAPTEEKEEMETSSALVPKAFFAGKDDLKVGDTETVKVLRLMDDEVEIECIKKGYDEEKEEEKEPVLESESNDMMAE